MLLRLCDVFRALINSFFLDLVVDSWEAGRGGWGGVGVDEGVRVGWGLGVGEGAKYLPDQCHGGEVNMHTCTRES